ncbi:hypothetical protein I316_04736 [Kwoniella heveanensis BCC8398]|uniref:BTB domain-containing protein n=1 Tax=Kwoniella heveanensis BCC8398 TaxID=1296120 RepID=A0A1B9GRH6_9TREE|nr:hypothetical protein I316_04736 [Kwoniella heveanensis BCC8398]
MNTTAIRIQHRDVPHAQCDLDEAPKSFFLVIDGTNRAYQFEDSDVTLISGDDVHFDSIRILMAASCVFRDLFLVGSKDDKTHEVRLIDPEIEHREVISLFLVICYGGPVPHYHDRHLAFKRSTRFLDKWDCKQAKESLRTALYAWTTPDLGRLQPSFVFAMATFNDEPASAKRAISSTGKWYFPSIKEAAPDHCEAKGKFTATYHLPDRCAIDLSACTFEQFKEIADGYKFALLRATGQHEIGKPPTEISWTEIADTFAITLEAIRGR